MFLAVIGIKLILPVFGVVPLVLLIALDKKCNRRHACRVRRADWQRLVLASQKVGEDGLPARLVTDVATGRH